MPNQSDKQAAIRAVTGTASTYEGDWHALWDMQSVPIGPFNQRMLAWINQRLGTAYTEINGAMAAYAVNQGATSWNALGTFSPQPAFTPASYGNLVGWYDAADITNGNISTSNGTNVSQLADKSGVSGPAVQATPGKQPTTGTDTVNGKNVIRFTTSSLRLPDALFTISTGPRTVILVFQPMVVGQGNWVLGGGQGANNFGILKNAASAVFLGGPTRYYNETISFTGETALHAAGFIVTAPSVRKFTDTLNGTFSGETNTALDGGLYFGANRVDGEYLNYRLCEAIFYAAARTPAEVNKLFTDYLTPKWGIAFTALT